MLPSRRFEDWNIDVSAELWQRERLLLLRRARRADLLLDYAERLRRCNSADDVHAAVLDGVPLIVGAHACLLLLAGDAKPRTFPVLSSAAGPVTVPISAGDATALSGEGIFTPAEVESAAAGAAALAPLFEAGAAMVMHVPYPGNAVLLLAEHRRDRIFTAGDRDLLHNVVCQAESALERLELRERLAAAESRPGPVARAPTDSTEATPRGTRPLDPEAAPP